MAAEFRLGAADELRNSKNRECICGEIGGILGTSLIRLLTLSSRVLTRFYGIIISTDMSRAKGIVRAIRRSEIA